MIQKGLEVDRRGGGVVGEVGGFPTEFFLVIAAVKIFDAEVQMHKLT